MSREQYPQRSVLRLIISLGAVIALILMGAFALPVPEHGPGGLQESRLPGGMPEPWWSQVTGQLDAREYEASLHPAGWQAPNRRQDLRTVFAADGVTVTPRREDPAWQWRWSLTAWGRSGQTLPALPVAPQARLRRVEYARDELVEWYENRPDGVEQGFTLAAPPAGDGPLLLTGRVEGGLAAARTDDGDLRFIDAEGLAVLDYGGLKAWDSTGRTLAADLSYSDGRLELTVDDTGAVYPVIIDPILNTPAWTALGDASDAEFGYVVATAGDVDADGYSDVLVGSPHYSASGGGVRGKVWLFRGTPTGLGASPAWERDGLVANGQFGYSVAAAGDVNGDGYGDFIVGAPTCEGPDNQDGRAYLFLGSSSGPASSPDWSADGGSSATSLFFGTSVATAGDLNGDGYDDIVVGDPNVGANAGRVSVWFGGPGGLGAGPDWYDAGSGFLNLGRSVSSAGDVDGDGYDDLLVGAPYHSDGESQEGAVYLYRGGPGGLAASPDQIIDSDLSYFSMGYAVSLAGDINGDGYGDVLIGCAPDHDFSAEWGHVRLYAGSAAGLATAPAWTWGAHLTDNSVGRHVACAGDMNGDGYADVAVGYTGQGTLEGRVMVFLGNFDGLTAYQNWWQDGWDDYVALGPVATAGDVNGDGFSDLIAGAPGIPEHSTLRGEARCWLGGSYGVRLAAGWVTESNQAWAQFGYQAAPAGDVNGDGFGDLLVGAPFYDNGQVDEGAIFLYLGSNQGLSLLPAWWAESNQGGASFGAAVASAGDVNGDGLPDILVGAPTANDDAAMEGAVFLWHSVLGGAPYGNPGNADWIFTAGQADADLGRSVACAGDVNGDGYADVIVGAPDYDNGHLDEGMVFVFHGSPTGLGESPDWTHDTGRTDTDYGFSVASAGDVNGDGYSDVIVGAPTYDHPSDSEGLAFVYLGSATGLLTSAPWWYAQSDQAGAQLGYSVASAGDVNGDGFSDLLVGTPYWDGVEVNGGRVQVWHGGAVAPPVGSPDNQDWGEDYGGFNGRMGFSVAPAGDVNGDGYGDIAVGMPGVNFDDDVDSGMARVYHGSAAGLNPLFDDWFNGGAMPQALYGWSVASAGDVNGDGFSDLVVTSPGHSAGQDFEGRVFVHYGNGRRGLGRAPRMFQAGGTGPLAPLGGSISPSAFALGARGRTPAGRGTVRLECEVKVWGVPFDGAGTVLGDWTDTGAPSGAPGSYVELRQEIGDLAYREPHSWRLRILGRSPFFPATPWLTQSWNGASEWDMRTGLPVGGTRAPDLPAGLLTNHPNPFNPATVFHYRLDRRQHVRLQVYDTRGRLVRTLVDAVQTGGQQQRTWDGRDEQGRALASGVYVARLRTAALSRVLKVTLMK